MDRNSISSSETCSKADKKGEFFFSEHQRQSIWNSNSDVGGRRDTQAGAGLSPRDWGEIEQHRLSLGVSKQT